MKDLSGAEKDKDWLGATRGHEVMWEPLDVTHVLRLLNVLLIFCIHKILKNNELHQYYDIIFNIVIFKSRCTLQFVWREMNASLGDTMS